MAIKMNDEKLVVVGSQIPISMAKQIDELRTKNGNIRSRSVVIRELLAQALSKNVSLPTDDTISTEISSQEDKQDSKQEAHPLVEEHIDSKPVDEPTKSLWDELNIDGI